MEKERRKFKKVEVVKGVKSWYELVRGLRERQGEDRERRREH